jgi:DNA-binding SARP family transcriptional activator/DNA-binding beta-propeller fold protein YncE
LLLLHGNRVVSRDRLIDELWDGSPPETASTALQVYVSGLRKALGHEAIVTRPPGYMISVAPGALDLERFELLVKEAHGQGAEAVAEKLREALALWRGPPLADLDDSFVRPERAELEERRVSALEQRIDAELELGLHADLVPELEALLREDPFRERRRAQLMLALYRSGRQADALDVYRRGRKLLADELGLEPGGELRQLEKAILEHDPALAPPEGPKRREPTPEEPRRRLLGRPRSIVVAGALVLAGALVGLVLALTGGSDAVTVEANSVAVVNPENGRIEADVPIGGRPVAIAVGAGGVWVANADDQTIQRIDPSTRKVVETIGLGVDVADVAVGFGSVWVAGGNSETLTRIDPKQNAVEASIDLGRKGGLVPQPVFLVATGAGSVWVTRGNGLLRVDPKHNEARTWLAVQRPQGLAGGPDAVWVTQQNEHVLRIDATTPKVTAEEDLSELPQFPVLSGRSLWLIGYGESPHVWRLDSTTLTPQTAIPFRVSGYPFELSGGKRALWTVGPDSGLLWRIDSPTGIATRVVRIGHHPVSVAAGEGAVWVGTQKERLR